MFLLQLEMLIAEHPPKSGSKATANILALIRWDFFYYVTRFMNTSYIVKLIMGLHCYILPVLVRKEFFFFRANIKWMEKNYAKTSEWLDNVVS